MDAGSSSAVHGEPEMRATLLALLMLAHIARTAAAGGVTPVGTPDDIAYAQRLWSTMERERLVGPDATPDDPFFAGAEPHGMVIEVLARSVAVHGHRGFVVVKRNYAGPGVSEARVRADRTRFLTAVTVMFRREAGYDPDNGNWFWGKFAGDGRIDKNPAGALLVGRVAKGMPKGCIACHRAAPGGDYVFNHDRFK